MNDNPKVKKIPASKALQSKVGMGTIDSKVVDKAQGVMESNKVDFAPIAAPHMEQLSAAIKAGKAGEKTGHDLIEAITQPIMNLKANAGTFNYPLISKMTGTVLMFIDSVKKVDDDILSITENLQKAVMVVIAQQMSGEGGAAGVALATEFESVCQRYMTKRI